tara:strand:+ start:509 stop:934 length:426 start_codon:yes stop_codon:yes gene_type:complete
MAKKKKTTSTSRSAFKHGYRSGLEDKAAQQIASAGVEVIYEQHKITYVWPERQATYTPDFRIPKSDGGFFYVETKGRFPDARERQKHILIKQQFPDIDIRFVFSNMNTKLYKGSKTTYAQWCEKHGFLYANKVIPDEWLKE